MNTPAVSLRGIPGGALITLEQIRDRNAVVRTAVAELRAKSDLADLRLIARLHNLPDPDSLYSSRHGAVGILRDSTDDAVERAVREWALAFAAVVTLVEPLSRGRGGDVEPGWVVMHACVRGLRFTVGGQLVEAVTL